MRGVMPIGGDRIVRTGAFGSIRQGSSLSVRRALSGLTAAMLLFMFSGAQSRVRAPTSGLTALSEAREASHRWPD